MLIRSPNVLALALPGSLFLSLLSIYYSIHVVPYLSDGGVDWRRQDDIAISPPVPIHVNHSKDNIHKSIHPTIQVAPIENDDFANINSHPIFILHVGPPKTATSTLQHYLSEHRSLLEKYNFTYVGKFLSSSEDGVQKLSLASWMLSTSDVVLPSSRLDSKNKHSKRQNVGRSCTRICPKCRAKISFYRKKSCLSG
jgi:hypothetical protein